MDIDPKDLQVEVYLINSHQGGWTLNKSYGVKITHKPSGLSASSEDDRSEFRNRATAMAALQAKVDEWDVIGRPAWKSVVVYDIGAPNPHNVDFAQIRKDMDNGILICRDSILKAIDYGIALQARDSDRAISIDADVNIAGTLHSSAVYSGTAERTISIDTDAKEQ